MTIQEIYRLAIKIGVKADLRDRKSIKIASRDLENPYNDTKILLGDPKKKVKKILVGIDIGPGEVLLAERLAREGKKIDLIIGHHPFGAAFPSTDEIVSLQVGILAKYGVPAKTTKALLKSRLNDVIGFVYSFNRFQGMDIAKFFKIPCMCIHTPVDNLAFQFLTNLFNKKKQKTLSDVVGLLRKIPEYEKADKENCGPRVFVGSQENPCGRIALLGITGGTVGPENIYASIAQAGVSTIVTMYQSEKHRKKAEKSHLNVVVTGHIASDSLGMNLFLDVIEKKGIEIFPCSGLIRVSRQTFIIS